MNEQDLAKKIAKHLDHGAANLDKEIVARLQDARRMALEKSRAHQAAWGMDGSSHGLLMHGKNWLSQHRLWLPVTVLILGLVAITYWQTTQQDNDDDVDASLLAGDLPIHAYVDNSFGAWLKSSSEQ